MKRPRKPTVVIQRFGRRPDAAQVARAVRRAVRRLGGIERFVKPNSRVLIKPNLGSPVRHTTGCVTDMRVLEAVVALARRARPREVFMAEGSLGPASSAEQFRATGAARMAARQGVALLDLKVGKYRRVRIPGGRAVRSAEIGEAALRASAIIDVAPMKAFIDDEAAADTERILFSLGMKNLKGLISNPSRGAFHKAEVMKAVADLAGVMTPDLTIIGGIYAGIGGDWRGSLPGTVLNVLIASDNVAAADAAAIALLGMDPWETSEIGCAAERGLGPASFDEMEIVSPQPLDEIAADLAAKIARARRRALPRKGPTVVQRAACSGCKVALITALNRLGPRAAGLGGWQVLMGQKVACPQRRGRYLLVGNCTARFGVRGVRIRGCPPSADAVYEALRAVP
jgi:uncharacterized protein (DUF362 family)